MNGPRLRAPLGWGDSTVVLGVGLVVGLLLLAAGCSGGEGDPPSSGLIPDSTAATDADEPLVIDGGETAEVDGDGVGDTESADDQGDDVDADDASATGTSQSEPSTDADADGGSTTTGDDSTTTDGDQTTTGETSADEAPSGTDSTEEAPATTAGVSTTVGGSDTTQPGDGILLAVLIIAADGDLDKALDAGLITEEDIETALKAIASGDLDSYISDP